MGSYARDFYSPKASQQPTIGDTKFSVVRQDHMGWMNCDGRYLSPEDYALLFRVVGYSFGQSGDLFQLPDMRSRVPGATYQGADLTYRTLGDSVGEETHLLTIAEMPAHKHGSVDVTGGSNGDGNTTTNGLHSHSYVDNGHTHPYFNQPNTVNPATSLTTTDVADNVNVNQTTGLGYVGITINSNGDHNHTMGSTGGSQVHNNMQPTLFIGNMFMYSGKLHTAGSKWRYENNTNIL